MLTSFLIAFFIQLPFMDVSTVRIYSQWSMDQNRSGSTWLATGPSVRIGPSVRFGSVRRFMVQHWFKNSGKNLKAQTGPEPIKWRSADPCLVWIKLVVKCFSERVSGGLINWKCEGVIKKSLSRPRSFSVISLELFSNRSFTFSLLQIISN